MKSKLQRCLYVHFYQSQIDLFTGSIEQRGWLGAQEHDTQFRHADYSIVYWYIAEGVPLRVCGRNLPLEQPVWSGVMSISAEILIVHLSTEWSDQARTPWNFLLTQNSTLNPHEIVVTSHQKHPVCQSPVGDTEKLTNVWSRYFGTNRIIGNWHWCLGVIWRKRNNDFDE